MQGVGFFYIARACSTLTGTGLVLLLLLFARPGAAQDKAILKRWKAPPRITIKAKKISVAEAVKKLAKRTGTVVTVDETKRDYKIALNLDKVTFFAALDEIAKRAGLALSVSSRSGSRVAWTLVKRPEGMKRIPPVLHGPLRIDVLGVYSSRFGTRRFSPNATAAREKPQALWVELRCMVEPGLEGLFLSHLELIHVTDDGDRSLIDVREFTRLYLNRAITLNLKAVGRGSLKIQTLRGKLVAYVPGKVEEVKFSGGARNSTRKLGEATFKVHKFEKTKYKRVNLQVTLTGKPCPAVRGKADLRLMTSRYRSSSVSPTDPLVVGIYAFDRQGMPIGGSVSRIFSMLTKGGTIVRLDKMPSKIVVKAVTQAERIEVPFRFRDLPIPR